MKTKFYLVLSANNDIGYDFENRLIPFKDLASAKLYFNNEKKKIMNNRFKYSVEKDNYFYGENKKKWVKIILMEKFL